MKYSIKIFLILLFIISTNRLLGAQQDIQRSPEELAEHLNCSLTINKTSFLPFEPILFKVKLAGPLTEDLLSNHQSNYIGEICLIATHDQQEERIPFRQLTRELLKKIIKNDDHQETLFEEYKANLQGYLKEPGDYTIRTVICVERKYPIVSEPINFQIRNPVGQEIAALKFINSKIDGKDYFGKVDYNNEKSRSLTDSDLTELIEKFSNTVYADYAHYQLGLQSFQEKNYEATVFTFGEIGV